MILARVVRQFFQRGQLGGKSLSKGREEPYKYQGTAFQAGGTATARAQRRPLGEGVCKNRWGGWSQVSKRGRGGGKGQEGTRQSVQGRTGAFALSEVGGRKRSPDLGAHRRPLAALKGTGCSRQEGARGGGRKYCRVCVGGDGHGLGATSGPISII